MIDIFDMQGADYESVIDRTGFDPDLIDGDNADQHFAALDHKDRIRGRCSIWWRDTASLDGLRSGAIGHYAATDEVYGRAVLEAACQALRNQGCRVAVGPMDGSTWRSYRFVTDRGDARPFFLEPDNPAEYPVQFARFGFDPVAEYVSEINPAMQSRQPELGDLQEQMAAKGIRIDSIDPDNADDDLDGVYRVVDESFKEAFLYTPLDRTSYRKKYIPLLKAVDPRLMLVARQYGKVVGFVFAPPDILQQKYQDAVDAIVIKTIAVLPRPEFRGLGRVLIKDLLANAIAMGFTTAISALMHSRNSSQRLSAECAGPMRRYALFAKGLPA